MPPITNGILTARSVDKSKEADEKGTPTVISEILIDMADIYSKLSME